MRQSDPLRSASSLLRPRLPRVLAAIALGVLSLGSALALAGISAWLITRAWQMPPVLDLSVAVVAQKLGTRRILTFDERHFRVVRPLQGGVFELLPSDA